SPVTHRALLVAACLLAATRAWAAKETFTPYHVAKLRSVTAAVVSPDGEHIAYLLSVPRDLSKEKDGTNWSELHVHSKGKSRPYVTGPVNVSAVRWTPDGKGISFLSRRDQDAAPCLYVIPRDGGEARRVVKHSTAIHAYSWAPDGKRLA